MLFKAGILDGIRTGDVTLAFRRWAKPSVRTGTTTRTAIGVVEITDMTLITQTQITERDALKAGFGSRSELLASLRDGPGQIYRIELRLAGRDPRALLREVKPSATEFRDLKARLDRMDAGRDRPWTLPVLRLIAERPAQRAQDLADMMERDMRAFKADVRKLKELGLTESLDVGYRLSARGRDVLKRCSRSSK